MLYEDGLWRSLQSRELLRSTTGFTQLRPVSLHRFLISEGLQDLLQDPGCALVWWHDDAVMHPLAVPPGRYYAGVSQVRQVPGNLWLRLTQNLHKIADTEFLVSHKVQQSQSCVVSEGLEKPLKIEALYPRSHERDYIRIDECVQ